MKSANRLIDVSCTVTLLALANISTSQRPGDCSAKSHATSGLWGKMCVPRSVGEWSLEVAGYHQVKSITKRVLQEKPFCDSGLPWLHVVCMENADLQTLLSNHWVVMKLEKAQSKPKTAQLQIKLCLTAGTIALIKYRRNYRDIVVLKNNNNNLWLTSQ